MSYKDSGMQNHIALAKYRALSQLKNTYPDEYVENYEAEMNRLGYERIPASETQTTGHRANGGWRRIGSDTPRG